MLRTSCPALALVLVSAAASCGDPSGFCSGPTAWVYDPLSQVLDAWPDDYWSVDDPSSPTGLRVKIAAGDNYKLPPEAQGFGRIFSDLSTLDGFGTTAALTLRFTGPLAKDSLPPPNQDPAARARSSVVLVDLDSQPPELVDFEASLYPEDDGDPSSTLLVAPMEPLREKTRYGLVVTTRARDTQGACIAPPPALRGLLSSLRSAAAEPALGRLKGRFDALLARLLSQGVVTGPEEISAAVVFTTQHTVEDSTAIARDIRQRSVAYARGPACTDPGGAFLVCEGSMAAADYRAAHLYIDEHALTPHDPYKVPVTTYLPKSGRPGAGPFPTVIYGHGLNGDRHQAERLAEIAAPRGYVTVAIDAVKHGNHPDGKTSIAAVDFFGINAHGADILDARKLRDNWRQSTYDKLQLVEMLRPGVDVDGDGTPDAGLDRLTYLGVSLGGIMAAEFLAFVPEVKVALPIVPGARVTDIIRDGQIFAPVIEVLRGKTSNGQVVRFIPLLQTAIDRGDSGVYAPHVLRRRLQGFDGQVPQLLMQMVINDDTVPNSTNRFFARALGVPHVGDELQRIGTVPHQQQLPASKNLDSTHTAGVFQYDVVYDGAGPKTQMATHGNVAANPVALAQTVHFLETALATGVGEILDPYRTLGVKK